MAPTVLLPLVLGFALLFSPTPVSTAASTADVQAMQLPTFTLSELEAPDAATLSRLARVAQEIGVFAVLPSSSSAGSAAVVDTLRSFVRCYAAGHLPAADLHSVQLSDGTLRRTLATATAADVPRPLPGDVPQACPQFAAAAADLRATISRAGHAYAHVLDQLVYGAAGPYLSAVHAAESLEHFQLFQRPTAEDAAAPTTSAAAARRKLHKSEGPDAATGTMLPMHSDVGMFLVMTRAEVFDLASVDGGAPLEVAPSLLLELPSGHLVRPLAPSGSLLVMHGEATHLWMPPASAAGGVRPYVPAHEVGSVEGLPEGQPWARTWFGRMFFPLADAPPRPGGDAALLLGGANLTFGEYRRRTHQAFRRKAGGGAAEGAVAREAVLGDVELVMAGCSPTRRLLMDEGSCGAGEMYCWMSCMKITDTSCAASAQQCVNPSTGKLWPQDFMVNGKATHCSACKPQCPASGGGGNTPSGNTTNAPSSSSFCNTNFEPTTMWMTGFTFSKSSNACVVFLFPEWVLDSAVKFAFACIGTFLMGLLVGGLTRARAVVRAAWPTTVRAALLRRGHAASGRGYAALGHALVVLLAAVQLCFGYFLMLVAMTYQAELFIMVVLGLAVGVLFSLLEVGGSTKRHHQAADTDVEGTAQWDKGASQGLMASKAPGGTIDGVDARGAAGAKGGSPHGGTKVSSSGDEEEEKLDPCC